MNYSMAQQELLLEVGKRAIDDTKKQLIPGTLVTPATRSDITILFTAGFGASHDDYVEHFAALIGKKVNIYVSEIRLPSFGPFISSFSKFSKQPIKTQGNTFFSATERTLDDILQIDQQIRERTEATTVIYAGHSMGVNLAVAAYNKQKKCDIQPAVAVKAFYGISPYPSFGDAMTRNTNLQKYSALQRFIDIAAKTKYGPLAYPLKDTIITEPIRFAIAGNDEVTQTQHTAVLERFVGYFLDKEHFQQASHKVFYGRNHCFNYTQQDYAPFNKNGPKELIHDLLNFVRSL